MDKPYKPLNQQISIKGIDTRFFNHKGVDYEIVFTQANPFIHTIKNCNTGKAADMLHSKLYELSSMG